MFLSNKSLLLTMAIVLLFTQSVIAANKTANCEITSNNTIVYKGKCDFFLEKGGTFSLSSVKRDKALFERVLVVTVYMVKKGVAEVRGLTDAGNNSRWGAAKRSKKDKACWVGEDFKICVR